MAFVATVLSKEDQVDVALSALLTTYLPVDVVIRYSVPAGLLATFHERLSRVVDAAVALGEGDVAAAV